MIDVRLLFGLGEKSTVAVDKFREGESCASLMRCSEEVMAAGRTMARLRRLIKEMSSILRNTIDRNSIKASYFERGLQNNI